MKIRNIIVTIILSICIAVIPTASVSASDYVGLITKCSLNCIYSDGVLNVQAKTQASGVMEKIGFTDIKVQKSSDLKKLTDDKDIGDFIESDRKYYTLSLRTEVSGGFYYRIKCTHYAKGTPFRSTSSEIQTAENVSKPVWIEPVPVTTAYTVPSTTATVTTTATEKKSTSKTASSTTSTTKTTAVTSTVSDSASHTDISTSADKTTATEKSAGNISSDSPRTSSNLPVSLFVTSVLAIAIAVASRRKNR